MIDELQEKFELMKQGLDDNLIDISSKHKTSQLLLIEDVVIWMLEHRIAIKRQLEMLKEYFDIEVTERSYRPFLKRHLKEQYEQFTNRKSVTVLEETTNEKSKESVSSETLENPFYGSQTKANSMALRHIGGEENV